MLMPATAPSIKRIVFLHSDGIHQIIGTSDEITDGALPVAVENFTVLDRHIPFASLVKVTARMAVYKAPMQNRPTQSFNEAQR